MMCWTTQSQVLHSIKHRLQSENGSAVVGFAIGAPFVLIVFIGFLEVAHVSWNSVMASTSEKVRLANASSQMELNADPGLYLQNFDDVDLIHGRGSNWNLWRIKE